MVYGYLILGNTIYVPSLYSSLLLIHEGYTPQPPVDA